jgi:hypothetical protein
MPDNVKLTSDKGSMQDRINARLGNSGQGKDVRPDAHVVKGSGPTRTHTNLHFSAGVHGTKRQGRDSDGSQ